MKNKEKDQERIKRITGNAVATEANTIAGLCGEVSTILKKAGRPLVKTGKSDELLKLQ